MKTLSPDVCGVTVTPTLSHTIHADMNQVNWYWWSSRPVNESVVQLPVSPNPLGGGVAEVPCFLPCGQCRST